MSIKVESLSKRYFIKQDTAFGSHNTLKEALSNATKRLLRQNVLTNSLEPFWALKDVSFEVNQGDRLAVIGKNGAGKSTLFKILSRITPPTSGRAFIKGRVACLLEIGTGFHPDLTGRENIFLNGALMGMPKQEILKKFDEIVHFADVEQFLDTPVKRYSSGMYVRLAFAVAAHLDPDILFVDEVLAVGDARFQKKCLGKMEQASREGRTILIITHNMGSLGFCNRGILLDKGSIVPTASLHECIQKYSDEANLLNDQHWQGDVGDERLRLYSLSITAPEKNGPFSKKDRARVETVFRIEKSIKDLVLGYLIFNKGGTHLVHYKASHQEEMFHAIAPGLYKMESFIDMHIFSEGLFRLELDFSIYNQKRICPPEVHIHFEVTSDQRRQGEPENIIFPQWPSTLERIS